MIAFILIIPFFCFLSVCFSKPSSFRLSTCFFLIKISFLLKLGLYFTQRAYREKIYASWTMLFVKFKKQCRAVLKTPMNYHLMLIKMASQESRNKKCWQGCWEKETLVSTRWACKLVELQTTWGFLKKLRIELLHGPEIPLLNIYLKKTKY